MVLQLTPQCGGSSSLSTRGQRLQIPIKTFFVHVLIADFGALRLDVELNTCMY